MIISSFISSTYNKLQIYSLYIQQLYRVFSLSLIANYRSEPKTLPHATTSRAELYVFYPRPLFMAVCRHSTALPVFTFFLFTILLGFRGLSYVPRR
jgi:hypothetical protein